MLKCIPTSLRESKDVGKLEREKQKDRTKERDREKENRNGERVQIETHTPGYAWEVQSPPFVSGVWRLELSK